MTLSKIVMTRVDPLRWFEFEIVRYGDVPEVRERARWCEAMFGDDFQAIISEDKGWWGTFLRGEFHFEQPQFFAMYRLRYPRAPWEGIVQGGKPYEV